MVVPIFSLLYVFLPFSLVCSSTALARFILSSVLLMTSLPLLHRWFLCMTGNFGYWWGISLLHAYVEVFSCFFFESESQKVSFPGYSDVVWKVLLLLFCLFSFKPWNTAFQGLGPSVFQWRNMLLLWLFCLCGWIGPCLLKFGLASNWLCSPGFLEPFSLTTWVTKC